jgi:hypothetical protein
VSEFAADIRRHLAREPVTARAPHAGYILRKFIARHRLESAAAMILLCGLTAAGVVATASWRAERRAAQEANAVNQVLLDTLAAPDPRVVGRDVRVVDVLSTAEQEAKTGFADQPLVRARLLATLGKSYSGLGMQPRATPLLQSALDLYQAQLGKSAADSLQTEADLIESIDSREGNDAFRRRAEDFYWRVRAALPETHPIALTALNNMGTAYTDYALDNHPDMMDKALGFLALNLTLRQQVYGEGDKRTTHARGNYAVALQAAGRYVEAESYYRSNISWQTKLFGLDNYYTLDSINNLASCLHQQKRDAEALSTLQAVLPRMRQVIGWDNEGTLYARVNEERILRGLGRNADAKAKAEEITQLTANQPALAELHDMAQHDVQKLSAAMLAADH